MKKGKNFQNRLFEQLDVHSEKQIIKYFLLKMETQHFKIYEMQLNKHLQREMSQ